MALLQLTQGLLDASSGAPAPTIGASVKKTYSGSTIETSAAITTQAAGSTLVAFMAYEVTNYPFLSFTDSKSNTWTLVETEKALSTYNGRSRMYVCTNATGGSGHTFSVSGNGGQVYPSFFVVEITNMGTSPVDVSASTVTATSPYTVTTPTTTAANEWLILGTDVIGAGIATLAESTGFTKIQSEADSDTYWGAAIWAKRVTSTGAYAPSVTEVGAGSVSEMALTILSLKEPAGGAAGSATLTGASATSARGTLAATGAASKAITGAAASSLAGTVTATGGTSSAGTASLTGAVSTTSAGTIVAGGQAGVVLTAPSLGVHNLTWSRDLASVDPTVTPSLTTTTGSSLLVMVANHNSNANVPTDNKGNTYTEIGTRQNYNLYPVYGVSLYVAHNITGGSGHVITTQQDGWPASEVSMFTVEVLNGGVLKAYSQTEVLSPADLVSGTVTVDKHALLLAGWWGDNGYGPHTAVPRNGFTALESVLEAGDLIQGAAAFRLVGPGTYSAAWDETPTQGALLPIMAIQSSAPGALATASPGSMSAVGSSSAFLLGISSITVAGVIQAGGAARIAMPGNHAIGSAGIINSIGAAAVSLSGVQSELLAGDITAQAGSTVSAEVTGANATSSSGVASATGQGKYEIAGISATSFAGGATSIAGALIYVEGVSASVSAGDLSPFSESVVAALIAGAEISAYAGYASASVFVPPPRSAWRRAPGGVTRSIQQQPMRKNTATSTGPSSQIRDKKWHSD